MEVSKRRLWRQGGQKGVWVKTYALHLPSLLPPLPPALLAASSSGGGLAVPLGLGGRFDFAAGEEGEPGALEGRVVGVGDAGGEVGSLVGGDREAGG